MKYLLILLTLVSCLTPGAFTYAADPSEDLFFSLKANLWYQGVEQSELTANLAPKMGEKNAEPIENKKKSTGTPLPEELVLALKNL